MLAKSRSLLLLLIVNVFLLSCDSNSLTEPIDEYEILASLLSAYENNSTEKLQNFLNQWHQSIQFKTVQEITQQSDMVQALYDLYQLFYDPFNLTKYGSDNRYPEVGDNFYEDISYVLIQNEIEYGATGDVPDGVVKDFRPRVSLNNATPLYLTDSYKQALNEFLNEDLDGEQLVDRLIFLNTFVKIVRGHWFGWHFLTHPEVSWIKLGENLTTAMVHFRIRFEGGEASFQKRNQQWQMLESKLIWIE